jgi:hypothetical protein
MTPSRRAGDGRPLGELLVEVRLVDEAASGEELALPARTSTPRWLVHESEYGPNSKWGATAGLEPEPLLSISDTCGATLTEP